MLVREAMTRNVPTIRVDKKLAAARSIMEWAHLAQLPVVDHQGELVGVITPDSLRSALPREAGVPRVELDRRLAVTPVANAVIADTPTVAPGARAWVAADLMARHQVTTLPVVENRRVTGMITASDLAAILSHYGEPDRAAL